MARCHDTGIAVRSLTTQKALCPGLTRPVSQAADILIVTALSDKFLLVPVSPHLGKTTVLRTKFHQTAAVPEVLVGLRTEDSHREITKPRDSRHVVIGGTLVFREAVGPIRARRDVLHEM